MTEYELDIARSAFAHALLNGAPGIAGNMRAIIVANAARRIRHQLNMPAPQLAVASAYREGEA